MPPARNSNSLPPLLEWFQSQECSLTTTATLRASCLCHHPLAKWVLCTFSFFMWLSSEVRSCICDRQSHHLSRAAKKREPSFVGYAFSSVQSLSRARLFATPWIAARQASLSITNSWSSPKLLSIESVMPSSHLILCHPLLLLPQIPPSIRVFSNESTLHMRWPKYCLREAQTRKVEVLQNSKDVQKLWYSQKNRKLPTVNHWRGIIFVLRNYCERQSYVLVHRWRVCLICDALPLVQLRIFLATCLMMYYNLLLPFASFSSTFKTICKSSLADTVNF